MKDDKNSKSKSDKQKEPELKYMVRHRKSQSRDRGGSSTWPAPLHKIRAEMDKSGKAKVDSALQSDSGIIIVSEQKKHVVMNSEENLYDGLVFDDLMHVNGQLEDDEDDLLVEMGNIC